MRRLFPILIITMMSAGCMARKVVTIPAKAAVKTTGKVVIGTTKAVLPNGDDKK